MFESTTFAVITLNSIWIWIETDLNHSDVLIDAHPVFIVFEQLFCFFFVWELLVRFFAFEKTSSMMRDFWFCFDTTLVTFMVLEVWVITLMSVVGSGASANFGDTSILRVARLLRLCRMMRVARLL